MRTKAVRLFIRIFSPIYVPLMKRLFKPYHLERRINIGGGNWYYPRWENIDYWADDKYVDYRLDLRGKKRLPLQDECVALVFSSHCLEHMSDEDSLFTLEECYRIMKPGGVIRISVPDMDKAFTAYRNNDLGFFEKGGVSCKGNSIERRLVNFFASYATQDYSGGPPVSVEEVRDMLEELDKYSFCRWCVSLIPDDAPHRAHVNAYDFAKLKTFLSSCGFTDVRRSAYRQSLIPTMRSAAFDVRPVVSLYVEALK